MTKERKFTPPTSFPAEYAMNDVDGTRVTLIGQGVGEFPYVGQDEDGYWRIFRRDGRNSTCAQYGLYDLPRTNVQWANDYEEIFGCTWHDSREEADANAMWDCIAVIRREWTEGQPPEYFTEEARMSDKCIVQGCLNHKHQGEFLGDLCTPCYDMITSGEIKYGGTFLHGLRDRTEELEAKLVRYDDLVADKINLRSENASLKAKLAKAVVTLERIAKFDHQDRAMVAIKYFIPPQNMVALKEVLETIASTDIQSWANTTLKELTGGKDE